MKRRFVLAMALVFPISCYAYIWVARYDGPVSNNDRVRAIAVDGSRNVYVTGYSEGSSSNDYCTIKYDTDGNELWKIRYDGGSGDYAYALTLDKSNNVYVTGKSVRGGDADITTIKYDSSGVQKWIAWYDGTANASDKGTALVADSSGNVYVAGYGDQADSYSDDYVVVKYDSLGIEQWVQRYDRATKTDRAVGIVLDDSGNIYVTGHSYTDANKRDITTIKYNPLGDTLWLRHYNNSPTNGHEEPVGIVYAGDCIYVAGYTEQSTGAGMSEQYCTIKYDLNGNEQWVRKYAYAQPLDNWAAVKDICTDAESNVYVTGKSDNTDYVYEYATIKYNPAGDSVWTARYSGPGKGADYGTVIAVYGGYVYVSGTSDQGNGGQSHDYCTLKYDAINGDLLNIATYNGPGSGSDKPYGIAIDDSGYIYITGESDGGLTKDDYCTIKYSLDLGIEETANSQLTISNYQLSIYPNPFTRETHIVFSISHLANDSDLSGLNAKLLNAKCCIYDLAGRLVKSLPITEHRTPITEVVWDGRDTQGKIVSPGIYFVKLITEDTVRVSKITKLGKTLD